MKNPCILIAASARFRYKGGKVPAYIHNTCYDINHQHIKKARNFLVAALNPNGELYGAVKIIWRALISTAEENKRLYEELESLRVENFRLKLGD